MKLLAYGFFMGLALSGKGWAWFVVTIWTAWWLAGVSWTWLSK